MLFVILMLCRMMKRQGMRERLSANGLQRKVTGMIRHRIARILIIPGRRSDIPTDMVSEKRLQTKGDGTDTVTVLYIMNGLIWNR